MRPRIGSSHGTPEGGDIPGGRVGIILVWGWDLNPMPARRNRRVPLSARAEGAPHESMEVVALGEPGRTAPDAGSLRREYVNAMPARWRRTQ